MKILKIWDADYPWDIRVEKICRALSQSGHEVHLLCRNLKSRHRLEEWEHGYIHRLPAFSNAKVNYILSFPFFFNPLWLFAAMRIIKKWGIELIIVRDLPLALAGALVGKVQKVPVIFDMAENYAFMVDEIWRHEPFNPFNFIVRNPFLVRAIERIALKVVDSILVVIDESRDRLLSLGVDRQKVDVVCNTPDIVAMRKMFAPLSEDDQQLLKDRYVIIYVGGLEIGRGLSQVIDSMSGLVEKVPQSLLLILGKGNAENIIRDKICYAGLSDHVLLKGWVDFEQVLSFISAANVGIIPHYISDHTDHTIPNKLFDYMSMGLPVVTSAAKPMVRVIQEEKCGLSYSNTEELTKILIELCDQNIQKKMGLLGKGAVVRRYNWSTDTAILANRISQIAQAI